MNLKSPGTNYLMLQLALMIAPLAVIDEAVAACAPASPVDNVTVTCTVATIDQNGSNGYGTSNIVSGDQSNTYNILTGGSVSRTRNGLTFFELGTVNNPGTITAGVNGFGI